MRFTTPLLFTVITLSLVSRSPGAGSRILTGVDENSPAPLVDLLQPATGASLATFPAFAPGFTGGVRVAVGDVNGDGAADLITGTGPGGSTLRVFSGRDTAMTLHNFMAFPATFTGGIYVASGDLNGDGAAELVAGADTGGAPEVILFDGLTGENLKSFLAYDPMFSGGVRVAVGDVTGDGVPDIITGAGPGGGPHIKVFNGATLDQAGNFFAFGPTFSGGVYVAAGDVNNDGVADIITSAGAGGGPHVKVFDGSSHAEAEPKLIREFFPYSTGFTGGVRVASGDINGDGTDDIITSPGVGALTELQIHDGLTLESLGTHFPPFGSGYTGGAFVAAASLTQPALDLSWDREGATLLLSWPVGEGCRVEMNGELDDPRGWTELADRPEENGNRFELSVPIGDRPMYFRLNCNN